MIQTHGYAAEAQSASMTPFKFERREPGPGDVVVEILYCGVCHSDIHQVRNEWGSSTYPMVPGHEIIGRVSSVGKDVTRFAAGDLAGVGVMVDSCRVCENCRAQEEAYCSKGFVGTYNANNYDGTVQHGGYSNNIVVDQRYVHTISPKFQSRLAAVAPLLCAGITTYSPLKHWKAGPGKRVGIVGLGGLGHMALKFAHSFGAHTVLFTTSPGKEEDAKRLGADEVVLSTDAAQMKAQKGRFDLLLDSVSAPHDLNAYLNLLRLDGTLCQVGLPEEPAKVSSFSLVTNRRSLSGSMIGGMPETQEMLDYCAENDIVADVEVIPITQLDSAYDRVMTGDVKYRFVIDMSTLGQ